MESKIRSSTESEDEEDDDTHDDTRIEWSNLIFLPFHPVFKLMVLFSVLVKSILGPIQSVYPIVYCWDVMDKDINLLLIKYFYWYCCDAIYGIDTFLHIVHRQVTDKAMRREHLPKSLFLLLLDIVSLIPFFRLIASDICPPVQLWPNLMAFTEFLVIYRVVEYFSLVTTHSFKNMLFGFVMLYACTINCITCFWLLLTKYGLCGNCKTDIYDWRSYVLHKLNETEESYTTYVYGGIFVSSFIMNQMRLDETKPNTILEFICIGVFVCFGYFIIVCIILPKLFAEAILRLRRIFTAHPYVQRLVEETKRRNASPKAYTNVANFYTVMWTQRSGITNIPEIMGELPKYLRVDIKEDLVWPVFYHSPTLRKTSLSFKRWICEKISPDFKLPGEKFYAGPHAFTNLYYLKSGVVQFLSDDEGATPMLSVTSGTIFGDINFFVPCLKRKVRVKCLTYCEVIFLSRSNYLKALHKYPRDRQNVIQLAKDRIKHARILYSCKQNVRGLERSEDEGIAWVKRRWWEIANAIENFKQKSTCKKDQVKIGLPPEEADYHCAKYIGQLVLCNDAQLQTKSMFANVKFPWILVPHSNFVVVWHKIVLVTVFLVLLLYPPFITRCKIPSFFRFFQFWTDFIYAFDVCISLVTAVTRRENPATNFASVMFTRCKTFYFILDVLATIWVEYLVIVIGKPEFFDVAQLNRLIKIYMLFTGDHIHWDVMKNPMLTVKFRLIMTHFSYMYILGYVVYLIVKHVPDITTSYLFGEQLCGHNVRKSECDLGNQHILAIAISYAMEYMFSEYWPLKLIDVYLTLSLSFAGFLISMFCTSTYVAAVYLKYREMANFQFFVSNLKQYYKYYKIHHDLLRRLDRYLICHWKYYQGADLMHPQILKNEPYDIYRKVQGQVAEKIIGESRAFLGADRALIRELAHAAKFLIIPENSTLFLFGVQSKNITWVVQGHIKCTYYNEKGKLVRMYYDAGYMLSVSSVFLGKASVRTYSACTECEILYIKRQDFLKILKHFPKEWSYINKAVSAFEPVFHEISRIYMDKYKHLQNKLREYIFHGRHTVKVDEKSLDYTSTENPPPKGDVWSEPESKFMQWWLLFRTIIVVVSIITASLQGGSGAVVRWQLIMIGAMCDCIAWMDIVIKLFLAYYDHRGIVIFDKRKCAIHYLTRGFILDMVGAVPWYELIRVVMSKHIDDNTALLINTLCKFAHLYLVIGYFDYIGDLPRKNFVYIMILKWQLVTVLLIFGASHYLMSFCVEFKFDDRFNLVHIVSRNTCWLPKFIEVQATPNVEQLHILFADSLDLAQCGLLGTNFGRFHIDRDHLGVGICLIILQIIFWWVTGYSLTLLILNSRGNDMFQHGVSQLRKFLTAERVDKTLINQAVAHFTYWWLRTKGINIHHLTNERISVVFRQDLSYYFYEKTFQALDTILQDGESLGRELATISTQIFVLPGHEIIREMDLISCVYVVHRGNIVISQGGENIVTLTKGSIFGQLDGTTPRPVKISAVADGFADLLQINIKNFQDLISDDAREKIASNPQAKNDYIPTVEHFTENPYDSIQYILRGRKTIKLPWMHIPMGAHHGNWYSRWLYLSWLFGPFISTFIVLLLETLPSHIVPSLLWFLAIFDIVHLANFIAEFFTIELIVEDNKCVNRIVGLRRFKRWSFYVDAITLIVPLISVLFNHLSYHLLRLPRLRHFYDFHRHFCRSFKSKAARVLVKFCIVFLLLHAMSCGWVNIACRNKKYPLELVDVPDEFKRQIDFDQWVHPNDRRGGCLRMIKDYVPDVGKPIFVVPKNWQDDYIVSMAYILMIFTHTAVQAIVPTSLAQIYYKVVITFIVDLIDVWITSVAFSFIYTKLRELYQYDYNVRNLITYLGHSGLSPALLVSVKEYTKQLWRRQRGNWLPELAQQAPMCLREDLLCALYLHHLRTQPLFRDLPAYFMRQVTARLKRVVIFPGKCIVQEGDTYSCIYFIHEGEIEKSYSDKSGENKMMSILTTNGYFGVIPGLFPNIPFQFSYHARTVVDLVYLRFRDWQDLLDGYPDVKRDLYTAAEQLTKDLMGKTV